MIASARKLWKQVWARNLTGSALILVSIALASWLGLLRPIDDVFNGLRFHLVERPASQGLVIVEIDSHSLEQAGVWPWERERYAQAIDRLTQSGASLVAFDVDFSAASDPESDAALATAISRNPGKVTLGAFLQLSSQGGQDQRVVQNLPLPMFRQDALIASVNVPVDSDGEVRRYSYASPTGERASLAANLAGVARQGDFAVDFGLDHATIPHLRFDDVLKGKFDPALVEGRVVLIGATALELGDEFATPIGLLPGVVIHGLAYESMVSGRALHTLPLVIQLLLCFVLGLSLLPQRDGRSLQGLLIRHAITAISIAVFPVLIQAVTPVTINVAALFGTQMLFGIWATRSELARRGRAIIETREAGLRHMALHHAETELPNRRALIAQLESGDRSSGVTVVVTVGIDRHSEMRGVIGYNVTNLVIKELAYRLSAFSGSPLVAHVSSSVLALYKAGLSADEREALLNRLLRMETHFEVDGHAMDLFLRFGVAVDDDGAIVSTDLVERATLALDRARSSNDRVCLYDPVAFRSAETNLALMTEMTAALGKGEISLHYQPKLTLADGRVAAVEALCRWRRPDGRFVPPDTFIPIAEETGHIRALTEWSIVRAIQDQARLRLQGLDVAIAINISGRLLADEGFREKVLQFASSVDTNLCLEITETAVIDNPEKAKEAIAVFREAGLKISIDDYGSGLSSLAYLKMLNADELKIDRSLVVELTQSQRDRLIMKSTIDLAHSLGMSVVVEGVEDDATAACLSLLGCDTIQGYWLSRPLAFADLSVFLNDRHGENSGPGHLAVA